MAILPLLLVIALIVAGAQRWQDRRQNQDAIYRGAEAALASGDFDAAELGFGALGGYRDADARIDDVRAVAQPVRSELDQANAAFDAGDYAGAIDQLEAIVADAPGYEPAASALDSSRSAWIALLQRNVSTATANRDWLSAELALRDLSTLLPQDDDIAAQLNEVVRDHAPIVYARDGAVFIDGPNGGEGHVLTAPIGAILPVWSPDRTQIAFIATSDDDEDRFRGKLMLMNGDGSDLRMFAEDALPYSWPAWSPESDRIAFTSIRDFDTGTFEGTIALHVVAIDSGSEIDLTGDQLPHAATPTWSPDGREIAFVSNTIEHRNGGGIDLRDGDVYVVSADGGTVRDLTRNRVYDEYWVQWSPAGGRLLIFTEPGDWAAPAKSRLYLLSLNDDTLTELPIDEWQTSLPFWSPDGTKIAYVTGSDTVNIWSDNGLQWIQLGGEVSSFATWSPDGRYLLAPPVDNSHQGYIVNVTDDFGTITPFELDYDHMTSGNAPPIWGGITPPAVSNESVT